jgi:hypothetical protein
VRVGVDIQIGPPSPQSLPVAGRLSGGGERNHVTACFSVEFKILLTRITDTVTLFSNYLGRG